MAEWPELRGFYTFSLRKWGGGGRRERKWVWMTVHRSHGDPPYAGGKKRSEGSRWRERWEEGIEAAKILYCKCCVRSAPCGKGKREGGGRGGTDGWMDGWRGGGGIVARCDVRWPELFCDAINLEARFSGYERGERYKLSLATGSGQRSTRTRRNA